MTILSHILGFPRIGLGRELKYSLERYWTNEISQYELLTIGRNLRMRHWKQQKDSGIDFVSVGDFSWYDHVLSTSVMLNNVPSRFRLKSSNDNTIDIDMLFSVARGLSQDNEQVIIPSEMKKWFNTNYHYIVPEFFVGQVFKLAWFQLFDELDEALSLGYKVKVVLLGPISYLWLGKMQFSSDTRLSLLPELVLVYQEILRKLLEKGVDWVQIDEPILVLELPVTWKEVYLSVYNKLYGFVKLLLTTYFDSISHNLDIIRQLSVDGLHVDLVSGNDDLEVLHNVLPNHWVLSLGVVNGRNIWSTDLGFWFKKLSSLIGERVIWVGSSCSLLHVPIDINSEISLSNKLKSRISFAVQKCEELQKLCYALNHISTISDSFFSCSNIINNNADVCGEVGKVFKHSEMEEVDNIDRLEYKHRVIFQNERFSLPVCPITTIGSFPQTSIIRSARLDFKNGRLSQKSYNTVLKKYIRDVIIEQEKLGLDVLVHGEPERNDMVEYFGEHLNGFFVTHNGWIQSYGSRCVKPPIIFDNVTRSGPITVEWITYAQSLTNKPVKGMLTGPVTMLFWSFFREDITRESISVQIALAIREELLDLEKNGIGIIQIDEPALREGLPLKVSSWKEYLRWAVRSFKLVTSVVSNNVQIHSHMCYSEFGDIINSIADMDVDVLSIECSRINVECLDVLKKFRSINAIGPGIYDIHSPNVPSKKYFLSRLIEMNKYIKKGCLWINPDCGLKTRSWIEVRKSLRNLVFAAKEFRSNK